LKNEGDKMEEYPSRKGGYSYGGRL